LQLAGLSVLVTTVEIC